MIKNLSKDEWKQWAKGLQQRSDLAEFFKPEEFSLPTEQFVEENEQLDTDLHPLSHLEECSWFEADWIEPTPNSLMGYQEMDGVSFLGAAAGGDWEAEVYFILYQTDEGDIRAFLPLEGNWVNTYTNKPVGNARELFGDDALDVQYLNERGYKDEEDLRIRHMGAGSQQEWRNRHYQTAFEWDKIQTQIKTHLREKKSV